MNFAKTAIIVALISSGCTLEDSESAHIGTSTQAVVGHNRVVANRVVANGLAAQSVASSSIASSFIADSTWEFNDTNSGGITDTAEGREVLDYSIRCALSDSTTIKVVTTSETFYYTGILGLAPEWMNRGMNEVEKELVSACLFAHVNHFGVSVNISLRFPNLLALDAAEAAQYKVSEGAFYGEYYVGDGANIKWYACQGDSLDVAEPNSLDRSKRVCTDATSGCALTVTGSCRDVCDTYTPEHGWSDCWGGGVLYNSVANVFLNADDPDSANATCGASQSCTGASAMGSGLNKTAILDGNGALAVEAACEANSTCILNGVQATSFSATVDNAIADVNCREAGTCTVVAEVGADVEIDCGSVNTCTAITCKDGASCLLQCDSATFCGFSAATTGAIDCQDGNWVHERACP